MMDEESAVGLLRQYFYGWNVMLRRYEMSSEVDLIMTKKLNAIGLMLNINETIRDLAWDFRDKATEYNAPAKPLFVRPIWRNKSKRIVKCKP
jgi:hypothetical protein